MPSEESTTTYFSRSIEPVLHQTVRQFPALILTGPRQSGKTTLLKHLFGGRFRYRSLEPPDVRVGALNDPRGFLESNPPPVILDEVQHAPILLSYIKETIDQNRSQCGQYILTGSQNLLMLKHVTETLAGRAAILKLFPLSRREIRRQADRSFFWERDTEQDKVDPSPSASPAALWPDLLRGGFPELWRRAELNIDLWHSSYIQTYLERDVRELRQIGDLTQFRNFLTVLAARSGQLLNMSDVARDLGVAVPTVKQWLSILEATYQIVVIHPYYKNIGKRLVKTPKVYFTDTGTLCHLVGLKDAAHAAAGPMGGVLMETAVLSEILKVIHGRGAQPRLFFWRTSAGNEVDFVLELDAWKNIPIEVKLTATPRPEMARQLEMFKRQDGNPFGPGFVIHPGTVDRPLIPSANIAALPFEML
jgi:hypothetical protein